MWPGLATIPARWPGPQLNGDGQLQRMLKLASPRAAVSPSPRPWRNRSHYGVPLVVALQLELSRRHPPDRRARRDRSAVGV